MPELIFLGGPPGVGKSTVAPLVARELADSAWLDGDDVWRIHPLEVTPRSRGIVERNITSCLQTFLQARISYVLLAWVLHRQDLIERLLAPLRAHSEAVHVLHLVARPPVLSSRCAAESQKIRLASRARDRLFQIQSLPYPKIDTSDLTPGQAARAVVTHIRGGAAFYEDAAVKSPKR